MSTGNDSILDAYLYETNTLLEQLDSIVLASEEKDTFSEEDINTIFRIMHTIKGSSAMMEYRSIMTIAHRAEDLFSIIRDKSMDIVPEANRPELFELLFQTIDFFRQEIDHIENGQPLTENIDSLLQKVNTLIQQIQNTGAPQPPSPGQAGAVAQDQPTEYPDFPYALQIFFDEGCGMENARAFIPDLCMFLLMSTMLRSGIRLLPQRVEIWVMYPCNRYSSKSMFTGFVPIGTSSCLGAPNPY